IRLYGHTAIRPYARTAIRPYARTAIRPYGHTAIRILEGREVTEFSKRLAGLPGYPMAELPAIKRRLIQQGVDLIDVGAGDADFAPPRVAIEALTQAVQDPAMSRYPFQIGLPAFREAAAA